MLRNFLLLLLFISFSSLAYSFKWHRGMYQIDQIDKGIQFKKYGEPYTEIHEEKLPLEFSKLAKFSANKSAKLFFRFSTGVLGKWEGPGMFSIETIDHRWIEPKSSNELADQLTRTILYYNKGLIFLNAVGLKEHSSILVETPLGKVITYGGIFSLKLDEFKDSTQRNAVIYSYKGSLIYTDQKGVAHALREGNKMSIFLKDGLFKVNRIVIDELEQRAVDNFDKERTHFIEADAFPKVKMAYQVHSSKGNEQINENEAIKEYYHFPVLKQLEYFDPYKKSYRDD